MSLRELIKHTIFLTITGICFIATSFALSLLLGTAASHPVLGPMSELLSYVQAIVLGAVGLATGYQIATFSSKSHRYNRA